MLSKQVERITKLSVDEHGAVKPELMYRRKERKKSSKPLRPFERSIRRMAKANNVFSNSYLSRHQRSKKKKDGWLRDFATNVLRAGGKASKYLRVT